MFEQVLDELADDADLLNQVLEIAVEDGEEFHILAITHGPVGHLQFVQRGWRREAHGVGGGGTRRWVACSKP